MAPSSDEYAMSDPEATLALLQASIRTADRAKRHYRWLSWAISVVLAIVGVLTANAGLKDASPHCLAGPSALLFYGIVTALCGAVTRAVGPNERSESHRLVKRATQLIEIRLREAVANSDPRFSHFDAERLRIRAKTSPEEVLDVLSKDPPALIVSPSDSDGQSGGRPPDAPRAGQQVVEPDVE